MKLPALQHAGQIELTAVSHCGRHLFVSTREVGLLLAWPGGTLQQTVKLSPLFDARFKEDGMLALCGPRTVTMVGLPHLERRPSAKKVSGTAVPSATWLHGDRLVTASLDPGRALLLDFMGNRLATLPADGGMVFSVATDDRWIAIYGDTLRVFDDITLGCVGTAIGHRLDPGMPPPTRFHHNGKRVGSTSPAVFGLAFSPSGRTLLSAGSDGRIIAWDPATVQSRLTITEPGLDPRRAIFVDEDTAFLTATTGLYRLHLPTQRLDRVVPLQRRRFTWLTPIGLSRTPDGRMLVFGGLVDALGVWDLAEDRQLG